MSFHRLHQQDNQLEIQRADLEASEASLFLPLRKIASIFGQEPFLDKATSRNILPENYNQAIQRSMSMLHLQGITFPAELIPYENSAEYYDLVTQFLLNQGIQEAIPRRQVQFLGDLYGEQVYILHLAETLENELYLSDILLKNVHDEKNEEGEYPGMGHGVFVEVINNLELYGHNNGYSRIGLRASSEENMLRFLQRGFVVENNKFGEAARESRSGYPMIKPL